MVQSQVHRRKVQAAHGAFWLCITQQPLTPVQQAQGFVWGACYASLLLPCLCLMLCIASEHRQASRGQEPKLLMRRQSWTCFTAHFR